MTKIVQCDDKLTVMAIKRKTDGSGKSNIKINPDHWKSARKSEEIYKYWNGITGKNSKSVKSYEYDELKNKNWIPCRETIYDTNISNAKVKSRDNNIFITLTKLSTGSVDEILTSRYRSVLDVVADIRPNVLDYKPRSELNENAKRNMREAARQMLKRKFLIHEYEYNVYINGEAGRELFEEIRKTAEKNYENTAYVKGYDKNAKGRKPPITVKCYNAGEKHRDIFIDEGDLYKLELTLRRPVFDKLGIKIADMTFQEECIDRLRRVIIEELMKIKGGEMMQTIIREVSKDESVLARVMRAERNIEAVRKKQEEHDKRMSALEAALKSFKQTK